MGIDPGSIICGYGVIDVTGQKHEMVEYGVVEAKKQFSELPRRLEAIFTRITQVIERTLPDEVAIENVFYAKNPQSLAKLAHARAVAMLAATLKQIPITEYSPLEVKNSVTGRGRASKEQVQFMVKRMLSLEGLPEYFDETDALAVALCHATKRTSLVGVLKTGSAGSSWKSFIEQNSDRVVKLNTRK